MGQHFKYNIVKQNVNWYNIQILTHDPKNKNQLCIFVSNYFDHYCKDVLTNTLTAAQINYK